MSNRIDNIPFDLGIRGTGDANWLAVRNVDSLLLGRTYGNTIDLYIVLRGYFGAFLWMKSIDGDSSLFDETISFSPRAKAHLAQELVDSYGSHFYLYTTNVNLSRILFSVQAAETENGNLPFDGGHATQSL